MQLYKPNLPNISTPRAAKMKNRRKNRRPRFPTCGNACITVSKRARIPLAIFNNLRTEIGDIIIRVLTLKNLYNIRGSIQALPRAILNTLMTRRIVGLMGIISDLSSSSTMPKTDKITMKTSNWFHLQKNTRLKNPFKIVQGWNYFSVINHPRVNRWSSAGRR